MNKPVRTRFAPSPTGFLHVGGVRTYYFAWLLARKHKGQFLLRIEDTDRERLVPGAVEAIFRDMEWLDITIDEGPSTEEIEKAGYGWSGAKGPGGPYGPYIQSLRKDRYKVIAEELVLKGHAYRCDCTSEELERERQEQMANKVPPGYSGRCRERNVSPASKHVIRLKVPREKTIVMEDAIRGPIQWSDVALRDSVLLKSDGFPTYHLAVVVDDHDMQISHVLRGEEWLSTAPLHVLTYDALGWERPIFAHLPSVLGPDGKKLSKRHGSADIKSFRDAGFLPEALLNYLLLVGWAPGEGEEQEIFTRGEMIERFTLNGVSPGAGIFSEQKLRWMNGMYIRQLPLAEYGKRLRTFIETAGFQIDENRYEAILPSAQSRMEVLTDGPGLLGFLFQEPLVRDLEALKNLKGADVATVKKILHAARETLQGIQPFDIPAIEAAMKELPPKLELKTGPVLESIRIAVTGKKGTPPLADSMVALGKETSLQRIVETESAL